MGSVPTPATREDGQAAAELLAALPAVVAVLALLWQVALAGHAVWVTGTAARAAARSSAVGADPRSAALAELPRSLRPGARVTQVERGEVRVAVRIPSPAHFLHLGTTTAEARFEPQR
jgi:hypothetical protein